MLVSSPTLFGAHIRDCVPFPLSAYVALRRLLIIFHLFCSLSQFWIFRGFPVKTTEAQLTRKMQRMCMYVCDTFYEGLPCSSSSSGHGVWMSGWGRGNPLSRPPGSPSRVIFGFFVFHGPSAMTVDLSHLRVPESLASPSPRT